MGVGVAGLQAIATAKRLGAVVEATDLRPTAKDQVESLGGKWLDVPMSDEEKENAKKAAASGYAWMPGPQYVQDQAVIVDKAVSQADIVITTALIPGRNAPRLIKAETIAKMKAGSVILDMAVETGGNVEGSVVNEIVTTPMALKSWVFLISLPRWPRSLRLCMPTTSITSITLFNKEGQLVINLRRRNSKSLVNYAGELSTAFSA
jgi:NAD(P) transhydrogenase subunit alpha